jgi:hypothetical protein
MRITAVAGLALAAAIVYMFPSILAATRNSPRTGVIVLVNAFTGWTVIGWAYALRMTLTAAAASGGQLRRGSGTPAARGR